MIPNPKRYSMNIQWSDEDQAYIVTVPDSPDVALMAIHTKKAVESWIMAALADNDPIPAPRVAMPAA